jgi:anaerobic selenocysteine-containing dehydrogenase
MSKPACIQWGVATDQLGKGSSAGAQARASLRIITGNLDKPGADVMPGPHPTFITDWEMELNELLTPSQRAKQIGSEKFKLHTWTGYQMLCDHQLKVWGKCLPAEWFCEANAPMLFRAMKTGNPYPVKAAIILANNPLVSYANSKHTYEALMNQELIVAMEYWLTPSAALADFILPAASWLERPVMTTTYGVSDWLVASARAIQPMYERKTDYEFWRELGLKMGQDEYWPWETDEEMFMHRLSKIGVDDIETYDDFVYAYRMHFAPREYMKYQEKGFATPSGKAEIKSSVLEAIGLDPLPHWVEPVTGLESSGAEPKDYPYILNAGGGFMPFFHSEYKEMTRLRILKPYPHCTINPETAEELGIIDDEWVYIITPIGKVKQRAKISESVRPGVIQAERGWWYPEKEISEPTLMGVFESNINTVLDDNPDICDEACGSWPTRHMLCNIVPVRVFEEVE